MQVTELLTEVSNAASTAVEKAMTGVDALVAKAVENEIARKGMGGSATGGTITRAQAGAQLRAVIGGDEARAKALSGASDATGGVLAHREFATEVIRLINEYGVARRLCRIVPMSSDEKTIGALSGTVTAYMVGENGTVTASDPAFANVSLVARKMAALVASSNELLDDAQTDEGLFGLVSQLFAEQFALLEDQQVLLGSGTGNNLPGIMTHAGVPARNLGTGDTDFADITFDDLLDLQDAVAGAARDKGVYVMHPEIWTMLRKQKNTANEYIFDAPGMGQLEPSLWGRPVVLSAAMPNMAASAANKKFVVYGDFSKYVIGERTALGLTVLREGTVGGVNLGETDGQALRGIRRLGGAVAVPAAFATLATAAS